MDIAARYADLCEDREVARRLFTSIALGHGRAVRAVRLILGAPQQPRSTQPPRSTQQPRSTRSKSPLDPHSALARTIRLRNPYVDPLSFIQVELLRRKRQAASKEEVPAELDRAILLTINGLAAGLRSTG